MRRATRWRGDLWFSLGIVLLWAAVPGQSAVRLLPVRARWLLLPVKNGTGKVDRLSCGSKAREPLFQSETPETGRVPLVGGSARIRSLRVWPLQSIWQ